MRALSFLLALLPSVFLSAGPTHAAGLPPPPPPLLALRATPCSYPLTSSGPGRLTNWPSAAAAPAAATVAAAIVGQGSLDGAAEREGAPEARARASFAGALRRRRRGLRGGASDRALQRQVRVVCQHPTAAQLSSAQISYNIISEQPQPPPPAQRSGRGIQPRQWLAPAPATAYPRHDDQVGRCSPPCRVCVRACVRARV